MLFEPGPMTALALPLLPEGRLGPDDEPLLVLEEALAPTCRRCVAIARAWEGGRASDVVERQRAGTTGAHVSRYAS